MIRSEINYKINLLLQDKKIQAKPLSEQGPLSISFKIDRWISSTMLVTLEESCKIISAVNIIYLQFNINWK